MADYNAHRIRHSYPVCPIMREENALCIPTCVSRVRKECLRPQWCEFDGIPVRKLHIHTVELRLHYVVMHIECVVTHKVDGAVVRV